MYKFFALVEDKMMTNAAAIEQILSPFDFRLFLLTNKRVLHAPDMRLRIHCNERDVRLVLTAYHKKLEIPVERIVNGYVAEIAYIRISFFEDADGAIEALKIRAREILR